jgi:hypothetical protein
VGDDSTSRTEPSMRHTGRDVIAGFTVSDIK